MKRIIYIIMSILLGTLFTMRVEAASGSINASTSSSTVTVGSTFTVTVNVSCSEALGSWQFGISYDSSNISLQSGDTNIAAYGDGSSKSKSYTYKFKAIASGNASIRITGASMVSWDDVNTLFTPSTSNTSVTIKTQEQIEASYSKDNNLKSLSIDGYELTPAFNKDVTEYKTEVPDDVKNINVHASLNDSTARVQGTGNIELSEGANKVSVTVTAQNGAKKTYVINVVVKDLTPINVQMDGKEYSVVKKSELLEQPKGYTEEIIKINDIDVPSYKSDITKLTLVGLKDDAGNTNLYIYDENKKEYKLYREINSIGLTLYPLEAKEIPTDFTKIYLNFNGSKYDAYTNSKMGNIIILYAKNVETGFEGFYTYDKEEHTFARYNPDMYEAFINQNEEYKVYLTALLSITILFFLICLVLAIKNSHLKKLIFKFSSKRENVEKIVENEIIEHEEEIVNEVTEDEIGESDSDTEEIIEETIKKHKKKRKKNR